MEEVEQVEPGLAGIGQTQTLGRCARVPLDLPNDPFDVQRSHAVAIAGSTNAQADTIRIAPNPTAEMAGPEPRDDIANLIVNGDARVPAWTEICGSELLSGRRGALGEDLETLFMLRWKAHDHFGQNALGIDRQTCQSDQPDRV